MSDVERQIEALKSRIEVLEGRELGNRMLVREMMKMIADSQTGNLGIRPAMNVFLADLKRRCLQTVDAAIKKTPDLKDRFERSKLSIDAALAPMNIERTTDGG